MDGSAAPLDVTARRVGAAVWWERRAFEVLGGWVADEVDPAARITWSVRSRHHAWRSEQLEGCLPASRAWDRPDLVRPASDAVAAWWDRVAEFGDVGHRGIAVVASDEQARRAYDAWRERCGPAADAALARVLDLVLHDMARDAALHPVGGDRSGGSGAGTGLVAELDGGPFGPFF